MFMGLLHDIFPGVDPPPQRDLSFEAVVRETAIGMGLEPEEDFVRQVVQVGGRHGPAWRPSDLPPCMHPYPVHAHALLVLPDSGVLGWH